MRMKPIFTHKQHRVESEMDNQDGTIFQSIQWEIGIHYDTYYPRTSFTIGFSTTDKDGEYIEANTNYGDIESLDR